MFSETASLYDLVYGAIKDYPAEAERIAALVRAEKPDARTLLDVGCGTGAHARLLADAHGFEVDGVDLEPEFVRIASERLQGSVWQADMTEFDLARRYDAVLCLFSTIGYVRTLAGLRRALDCFRRHLAPGGVVIVEPWLPPDEVQHGHVMTLIAESPDVAVCRMSRTEVEGRISRLHFEYLIGRVGGIRHTREVHELGMFTVDETLDTFRAVDLEATHRADGPAGRGLYIARAGG
jgi:SAM-dependent methyltransferase